MTQTEKDFTQLKQNRNHIAMQCRSIKTMDIDALHSTLLSITVVSEKLRSAREFLPVTENAPAGLEKFFYEMESDLRIAKATLGGELGFTLCPRCWPPELATTDKSGQLNCPVCGVSNKQVA